MIKFPSTTYICPFFINNCCDLYIDVPIGTIIKDAQTGKIVADLSQEGQEELVLKGGRGGKGNSHFATATRQVPRFAQAGEDGEEKEVILELKLL